MSEIFRIAVTLQRCGYVMVDDNNRYTLSIKLFELSHRQHALRSLVTVAQPLLQELAHRARQSCHLAMYQGAWWSSRRWTAPSAGRSASRSA